MSTTSDQSDGPPPDVVTSLRGTIVLPTARLRRRTIVASAGVLSALALVACGVAEPGTTASALPAPAATRAASAVTIHSAGMSMSKSQSKRRKWISGAAGEGVSDGSFGRWRGRKAAIAATWNEDFDAQEHYWALQPGAEYGSWQGDLDIAVGSIYQTRGESWARAAKGEYDTRWAASLRALKSSWTGRSGTVYIRFAHEFNGDWFEWRVQPREIRDFIRSWRRYRALQKQIFPAAKLVFCPNDGTVGLPGYDWRRAFPGKKYVDIMAVDSFNQFPFVSTKAQFRAKIMGVDRFGAPLGIEQHRRYAKSRGLPFAVSEWSSNASMGDSPVYMSQFYKWVSQHAGRGKGKIRYEILFNVRDDASGVFQVYQSTRMPKAAKRYRKLF